MHTNTFKIIYRPLSDSSSKTIIDNTVCIEYTFAEIGITGLKNCPTLGCLSFVTTTPLFVRNILVYHWQRFPMKTHYFCKNGILAKIFPMLRWSKN